MAKSVISTVRGGIIRWKCLGATSCFVSSGHYKGAFFSTHPAVRPEMTKNFRTPENNPLKHCYGHVGQFYTVPPDVIKNVFSFQTIPKTFIQQASTFRELCIMVRKPVIEVINFLEKTDFSKPAVRYILYGKRGVGKSICIVHLVHYGHEKKWLLVHIPWGRPWAITPSEYVRSQSRAGRVDLPINSSVWLQQFKAQNSTLLQQLDLKVSMKYTWSSREVTEEGEPLINVIDHGINRIKHSSDCLAVVLKEIKMQAESNRYKTLVICHGVNAFFQSTTMEDEQGNDVPLEDVTPIRAFRKLLKNDWHNAVVVASVDPKLPDLKECATPRALLGKEGFNCLDPFVPIHVEDYTDKEIESCLDYYIDRGWIQSEEGKSERGRAEIKFLCAHNPRLLLEICGPL